MANTDVANKLFAWILGGVGTLLVYSAYKSQNPLNVLRQIQGEPIYASETVQIPSGGKLGEIVRIRLLANREIQPELVVIPGGGRLDRVAAASIVRINQKLGYTVQNVGTYRSYQEQAEGYAKDPSRFAKPGTSLHEVGLAIDVHEAQVHNKDLVDAFTKEGWHRARWGAETRNDEPWHWSYGVSG